MAAKRGSRARDVLLAADPSRGRERRELGILAGISKKIRTKEKARGRKKEKEKESERARVFCLPIVKMVNPQAEKLTNDVK